MPSTLPKLFSIVRAQAGKSIPCTRYSLNFPARRVISSVFSAVTSPLQVSSWQQESFFEVADGLISIIGMLFLAAESIGTQQASVQESFSCEFDGFMSVIGILF